MQVTRVRLPKESQPDLIERVWEWFESAMSMEGVGILSAIDDKGPRFDAFGVRPREKEGFPVVMMAWTVMTTGLPYEGDGFRVVKGEDGQIWAEPGERKEVTAETE